MDKGSLSLVLTLIFTGLVCTTWAQFLDSSGSLPDSERSGEGLAGGDNGEGPSGYYLGSPGGQHVNLHYVDRGEQEGTPWGWHPSGELVGMDWHNTGGTPSEYNAAEVSESSEHVDSPSDGYQGTSDGGRPGQSGFYLDSPGGRQVNLHYVDSGEQGGTRWGWHPSGELLGRDWQGDQGSVSGSEEEDDQK